MREIELKEIYDGFRLEDEEEEEGEIMNERKREGAAAKAKGVKLPMNRALKPNVKKKKRDYIPKAKNIVSGETQSRKFQFLDEHRRPCSIMEWHRFVDFVLRGTHKFIAQNSVGAYFTSNFYAVYKGVYFSFLDLMIEFDNDADSLIDYIDEQIHKLPKKKGGAVRENKKTNKDIMFRSLTETELMMLEKKVKHAKAPHKS